MHESRVFMHLITKPMGCGGDSGKPQGAFTVKCSLLFKNKTEICKI